MPRASGEPAGRSLRHRVCFSTQVYSPAIINYGAIAQTWEDPEEPDDDTGLGGDNDPIDVLQLNEGSCERGAVQRVRVLGGLALVDGAETG